MLRTASILFCDRCDNATARFERGWFAFRISDGGAVEDVTIVCPDCAEQMFGEDETPRSE